jgi:hypothetical protein
MNEYFGIYQTINNNKNKVNMTINSYEFRIGLLATSVDCEKNYTYWEDNKNNIYKYNVISYIKESDLTILE